MQMTGMNQRAMADIDMIANDRWVVVAVDMDTAIIYPEYWFPRQW